MSEKVSGRPKNADLVVGDEEESHFTKHTGGSRPDTSRLHSALQALDSQPLEGWLCGQLCVPSTHKSELPEKNVC